MLQISSWKIQNEDQVKYKVQEGNDRGKSKINEIEKWTNNKEKSRK